LISLTIFIYTEWSCWGWWKHCSDSTVICFIWNSFISRSAIKYIAHFCTNPECCGVYLITCFDRERSFFHIEPVCRWLFYWKTFRGLFKTINILL